MQNVKYFTFSNVSSVVTFTALTEIKLVFIGNSEGRIIMANENKIVLVEVLNGVQVSSGCSCCSAGCSSESSCSEPIDYADLTRQMALELKNTYGDQVDVNYVDVDQVGLDKYPIMKKVLQMGYPYPITLVDGQPKFAGGIMTDEVKETINEVLFS